MNPILLPEPGPGHRNHVICTMRAGATVIWSCHIGIDHGNEYSRNAWRCPRPRLTGVRRFVFSRQGVVAGAVPWMWPGESG